MFKAKKIGTDEWIIGNYIHSLNGEYIAKPSRSLLFREGTIFEVDPDTICQYTGLIDNNGKKIWENDIVKIGFGEKYGAIKYDACRDCVNGRYHVGFFVDWTDDDFLRKDLGYWVNMTRAEIVGNIFDSTELLKQEDKKNDSKDF